MNWIHRFKAAQITPHMQDFHDILAVAADILAEKGHTEYESQDITDLINSIEPIVRQIVEPQIANLEQEVRDTLNNPPPRPEEEIHPNQMPSYEPLKVKDIDIDKNVSIEVYVENSIMPEPDIRFELDGESSFLYLPYNEELGLIEPFSEDTKNKIFSHIFYLIKYHINMNSDTISQLLQRKDMYPETYTTNQGLQKLIGEFNHRIIRNRRSTRSPYNRLLYLKDEYLINVLEKYVPDKVGTIRSGPFDGIKNITYEGIMSLPQPVLIHVINYMKDKINGSKQ